MENKRDTGGKLDLIVVSSVTYALKSRDLLFQRGIKAYIERLPRTRESGCGYGVYVPQRTDEAERILRDAGVKVSTCGTGRKEMIYLDNSATTYQSRFRCAAKWRRRWSSSARTPAAAGSK